MCSTYSCEMSKGLSVDNVKEAIKILEKHIDNNITVFVFGVNTYRDIKSIAVIKEVTTPTLYFTGIPYFLVYSATGYFCKILEVDKNSSVKELEIYLIKELGELPGPEYPEIFNFFKSRLNK